MRNAAALWQVGMGGAAVCYSYSCSKGAFAGVSVEGSLLTTRSDVNLDFYGGPSPTGLPPGHVLCSVAEKLWERSYSLRARQPFQQCLQGPSVMPWTLFFTSRSIQALTRKVWE